LWLRVRPGSDGALALGIAGVMIERGWYDRAFVRDWTNGPLLVRSDDGRLLTEADLTATGSVQRYVAWDTTLQRPLVYDPARRRYARDGAEPALFGEYKLDTPRGALACRPAFDLIAENCRRFSPDVVAAARPRARPFRAAAGARAHAVGHDGRALSRDPRRTTVRRAGTGRLRREPSRRACRRHPWARRAGGARLLRPRRRLHESDRGARRRRAACRDAVRARSPQARLRGEPRGAVARSAQAAGGRAARRGALRYRDRLRAGAASRPRRALLERRHRRRVPPPAGPVRSLARHPAREPGRRPRAAADALPKVRRGNGRRPDRVRHADAEDRALLRSVPERGLSSVRGLRGALGRPACTPGAGRPLSIDIDVRQGH